MYKRYLKLNLPERESAYLIGARKTGKSTYLRELYPNSTRFDFLSTKLFYKYNRAPWEFKEDILNLPVEALALPIIIDEVQKVPAVMDEIHWLIENTKCSFILCGSSTRKMKKIGVNLLGGRALKYHFYPLVYPEIKEEFNLLKIFNNGLLPKHYRVDNAKHMLSTYLEEYLSSEIKAEGLVRNLSGFGNFLKTIIFSHGEQLNYSNIARDVAVHSSTVKEYYQILEDTLVGYFVYPYLGRASRRIISSVPKFYLFDVGIANRLMNRKFEVLQGIEAGKSFEHYIYLELLAYIKLNLLDHQISYWRTHTGIEVDFIIHLAGASSPVPVEVKISSHIHKTELKNLKIFMKEYGVNRGYIVCMEDSARRIILEDGEEIIIYPVKEFLEDLWAGKIFKE